MVVFLRLNMSALNLSGVVSPRLRQLLITDPANENAHRSAGYNEAYTASYELQFKQAKQAGKSEGQAMADAEALALGAEQERERWRGIEAVAADLGPGCSGLIRAMKADGRYTGADLAQAAMAMRQPENFNDATVDRLKIQRDATVDWQANPSLRMAFDDNWRAYSAFRTVSASSKG
ncbi:MAG: hypothetical protein H7293_10910 [Candidatus Saccharibacteria bacterium]|nr:hypothetical protein [Rhodoferax sp.]